LVNGWDCFGRPIEDVNTLRFVNTLRAKIEKDRHNPRYILTVREIGYKFEPEELEE
jgi:DNA-binding response OmpR family regulator